MVRVVCHFKLRPVPRAKNTGFMGGIYTRFSSFFRQTLGLFDICILWLVAIGSHRGERKGIVIGIVER